MSEMSKCPVTGHTSGSGTSNRDWWPDKLNLNILRQHSSLSNPMGEEFNYAEECTSSKRLGLFRSKAKRHFPGSAGAWVAPV